MRISWSPPSLANGSLLVSGCADGGARIFSPKKENNNLSSENGQPVYDSKPVHLIEHGDRNEVYIYDTILTFDNHSDKDFFFSLSFSFFFFFFFF